MALQKITPFLWFDTQAAAAAEFYTTVFKNSRIVSSNPMVTTFELEGLTITAINGGPMFQLSEAFSLQIHCDTQEEIDYYWENLSKGGNKGQCGWLIDQFGLSWQVIPTILPELMSDPEKSPRVVQAFMKMKKFDIAALLKA